MSTNEQLIGRVIDGKYRLEYLLGNGGMGAVYAGTHLQLGRHVAIKVLRSDLLTDQLIHARFVREARASARIEHPNAIRVYDFGALDDLGSYLVMEFAEGVSLRQLIAERGPLPLALTLNLLQQAAAALDAAHANGIIHRDVKPENMMVCFGADGWPVLKVVDFGIAKLLTSDGTTQLTQPSDIIGTPRYMAPEQFTGEEIDGRIDVYALGIVLFEMLTARAPFEGTFSEIIGKHIYAEPPALGVDVPAAVEHVVRRALEKSPAARFQTPLELAAEFAEACGPEIAAAVPSAPSAGLQRHVSASIVLDPSEAYTAAGTVVAGSPVMPDVELAPDAYVTRVAVGVDADEITRVKPARRQWRRRPSAKIVVPLGEGTTSAFDRARTTARQLIPPVLRARWAAPAVLALAGCLTFGTVAYQGDGGAAAVPALAPAVQPVSQPAPVAPKAAAPEERAADTSGPDDSSAASAPRKGTNRAERRRADAEARPTADNAFKKVGRALRVDRHLRRLF